MLIDSELVVIADDGFFTLGTVIVTLLALFNVEVRVRVAAVPLAAQVPVAPVLEHVVPCNVRVLGNCTMTTLPATKLLTVVNVTVHVDGTLTELFAMATAAVVITPAVAVTALVAVSITYTTPLLFVTVVNTKFAGRIDVGYVTV